LSYDEAGQIGQGLLYHGMTDRELFDDLVPLFRNKFAEDRKFLQNDTERAVTRALKFCSFDIEDLKVSHVYYMYELDNVFVFNGIKMVLETNGPDHNVANDHWKRVSLERDGYVFLKIDIPKSDVDLHSKEFFENTVKQIDNLLIPYAEAIVA
jgi:very-short-patch-repair endonuclease